MRPPSCSLARIGLLGLALACHHVSDDDGDGDGGGSSPGTSLSGVARFLDVDDDGLAGPGDRLVVVFQHKVRLNDTDATAAFQLPVQGDSLGAGATMAPGADPREVVVTLGTAPRLRARGRFSGATGHNQPSAVDVSDTMPANAIERLSGGDARPGQVADVVPELVPGDGSGLGATAVDVAAADLDRDGQGDVVTATADGEVEVHEGLAGGGFASFLLDAEGARRVALADLRTRPGPGIGDSLGGPDLLVLADSELSVFENVSTPGGTVDLAPFQTLGLEDVLFDLAVLDADRDGDLDVALAAASGVLLATNDGTGVLSVPGGPIPGSLAGARDLAAGDVDGDGHPDLLVAADGHNQLLLNAPCGGFSPSLVMGVRDTTAVALADLDQDGRLDAIGGSEGADVEVWHGAGDGTFTEVAGVPSPTQRATALVVVDVDRDSFPDLVWADGTHLRVAVNDRAGLLLDTGQTPYTGEVAALAPGDFDRDGDDDVVLAGGAGPVLMSGSLSGTWGRARFRETPFDLGTGPVQSLASADVDRDGLADLAAGRDTAVELRRNLGGGRFALAATLDLDEARAAGLAFADLDLDGDADLVVALLGDGANVYLNDGAGFQFTPWAPSARTHYETSVQIADLDRDGAPDLAFGTQRNHQDHWIRNLGVACEEAPEWLGLDEPIAFPGTPHTSDVAAADVDSDGDADLLFAHGGNEPDRLFRNDGLGGFELDGASFPPTDTRSLSFADVDLDGSLDFVAGKPAGNELWRNDGLGGFTQEPPSLSEGSTFAALLTPLDGDAYPDLLLGNALDQGLQIWFGGPAGFAFRRREASQSLRAILAADLDGSGSTDFVTGRSDDGPNRLWLGL